MSTFDDASLVFIPSGYKTSKAYSVKPIDGSGDLTFTRSNDTATRVASNGLIQKVRTNLALQSQTFDNASWTKTTDGQVTITANAATAPDGTTTAEKMIPSAIAGFHCVAQTITLSAGEVTISVFAKAAENSFLQIFDSLTTDFANFNLTTGAVGSTDVYVASIQSAGNGWFRCTATKVVPSGSFVFRFGVVTTATAVRGESFTGNGTNGLLIWGAQLEYGVATDYIATTSASVSVGPVANVPRLDYLGSSCPRLLLEPQRQNVITFSEQMDNAAWNKIQSSVTANAGTSPDGYTNADKFIPNTSNVIHFVTQTISSVSASWTYSIFAKAAGYDRLILNAFNTNYVGFNLTSGIVESSLGTGVTSANIENYGNGWYRCSITSTSTATGTNVAISVFNAAYTNGNTNPQFAGNGTDGILIYGAQLEQGSYSTSLIPTLGSAVTRGADACSKTGISSLIGQTEGTLFADITLTSRSNFSYFAIAPNLGSTSAYIGIGITSSAISFEVVNSGVQVAYNFPNTSTGRLKLAFAYKANDFVAYVNGALVHTDTSGTVPTCSEIGLNAFSNTASWNYNQALLFKTRLTNSELAALTTL